MPWLVASILLLGGCGTSSPEQPTEPQPELPVEAGFAGSDACAKCHAEVHETWTATNHARAWTPPSADDPRDPEMDLELEVAGWVGWEPLRQPLVRAENGRIQVWGRAWDPAAQEWFEVFDDGRREGDRGHWTGPSMVWNSQCAPCHTTGLDIGYSANDHVYATTAAEHGVGCEACHGEGSLHARSGEAPLEAPTMDTCAPCHARRADLAPGHEGAVHERFAVQLVDRSDAFWPDGQIRDEDFEYNAFLTSRMFQQGVQCTDCHDPHTLELVRDGDALCLECHETHEGWATHDHHDGQIGCVDCHMPTTTYMQRDPRHDHGFRIPDPELAAEIGAPVTCTRSCHSDRDPGWAAAAVREWGVDPDARRGRARARAVVQARAGDPEGYTGALQLLQSDPHPTWKAIGAGLLEPWGEHPEVRSALLQAAKQGDPLTRFAAVGSLPLSVGDPDLLEIERTASPALRVQLGRKLMGRPVTPMRLWPLRDYLEAHRDQPDPAIEYAAWLALTSPRDGDQELRKVVTRWPRDSAGHHALAVEMARQGKPDMARLVLQRAVRYRPEDPALWDALGRALVEETGDAARGIEALEKAVELDPERSRSWYNLGILRDQAGDAPGALKAWSTAARVDPQDADALWATASLYARQGESAKARSATEKGLERQPGHRGLLEMKAYLEGAR